MRRSLHILGTIIEVAGVLVLLYCLFYVMRAQYFQMRQRQALAAARARIQIPVQPRHTPLSQELHLGPSRPPVGSVLGWIEIPRLKISTVVLEGDDNTQFDLGAGHIPGTAEPGEDGNVVIAAHRDTFFRNLRKVAANDRIIFTGATGSVVYKVEKTEITHPENISVMQPHGEPELTLVTCYPFTYIGSAPERFIVHAKKIGS